MALDRTNTTILGRWWFTLDRVTMIALIALICIGAVLVAAASPPVATRIGLDPFYFIQRQYIFLFISIITMVVVSLLSPQNIRRLAVIGFLGSIVLMMLLPFVGAEVKGAKRWINAGGISVQPSEFLKPCFAVVMAWIFSLRYKIVGFPGFKVAIGVYALSVLLLIIQPDFGMVLTVSGMWAMQFFLAGLPFLWVVVMVVLGCLGVWGAYMTLPHVAKRIDNFLDPSSGDNYQIAKSMQAFENGGLLGRGPGEGQIKQYIPDSHTDFIFAVAGEEFGLIACLVIVALFAFVVLRGMVRVGGEKDLFIVLAVVGLLGQFGIQAIVNMGVAVNLLPAKGMTLPFLSYGGSSLIAIAIGMGMMLSLTRRRYGKDTKYSKGY